MVGIVSCVVLSARFCFAASGKGLGSLDDNALYSELADRGLDELLQRAMDVDGVAPDQRAAIASMSSLHRLEIDKNLSDDQRQALLTNVVGGLDRILGTLHGNPELIIKEARIIADQGVDPLTGLLEYWGKSDVEQDRLRPLAQAALKMYDQAAQTANAQATDLANRITSPDDKLADQWRRASEIASAAEYQKARMQYALALAMDSADSQRGQLIDEAIKSFESWDNGDSQIQPQVRLLLAKLHVLNGDKDEIATSLKLLNSIIQNQNGEISPAPSPEMIFEARCFSVIALLASDDIAGAQTA
ncbi:MAG TPA: hypothetical protein VGG44_02380, partial [Tepidisphaeraceae bacterium]